MRQNGNIKSNTFYNPNEIKNPPPVNLTDDGRDSEMEKYLRGEGIPTQVAQASI
jgi:stromal membrane-associated protein